MNPDIRVSLRAPTRSFFIVADGERSPRHQRGRAGDPRRARGRRPPRRALHRAQARARYRRKHLQGPGRARAAGNAGSLRQHRAREVGLHPRLGRARHARRSEAPGDAATSARTTTRKTSRLAGASGARIEDLLKEGQEIVVQVTKEPISTKGARTTRYISLPGRHLVFMPTVDHIGISRRIASDKERRRLRDIVESMRPPGSGFIVRTVAEGVSEKELRADMEFLIKLWNEVVDQDRDRPLPLADLQRPRPAAAHGARPVHRRRREADHRFADRVRPDQEVHRGVHAGLHRADRALRRPRPDLRRLRHRDRDRPRAGAQGLAQVGRLPHRRRDGGADRHRRQHRALRRQEEPGRHDHQDQPRGVPGGRRAAAHPLHRRHDRRRLHRHGPRLTTATRSCARSTTSSSGTGPRRPSPASRSWAWSR